MHVPLTVDSGYYSISLVYIYRTHLIQWNRIAAYLISVNQLVALQLPMSGESIIYKASFEAGFTVEL